MLGVVPEERIAKPLYGLTPVPRVRIPPSPHRFSTLLFLTCGYRKLSPSWKRENLVCMPTLSAGETDRGNHLVAIQGRSESQSGECKGQSGVSSRRDCFGS